MLTLRISSEELKEVNYERYQYPVAKIRIRFMILSLLAQGLHKATVAQHTGVHTNTVRTCIRLYNHGGLDCIKQLHYKGRKSRLANVAPTIEQHFRDEPPKSSREAAARIDTLTHTSISASAARRFMRRIGMRCMRQGQIPGKVDPKRQRDFLDTTLQPLIDEAHAGKRELFFVDSAHFILESFICMVWCFVRQFVRTGSGRNRINVLGAINAVTQQLETVINTAYITSTEVVVLLEQLRAKHYGSAIDVVLDNARYQHCNFVKEAAGRLRINLVFLPPYSPNLNLIERLWKLIRKRTLHGRYYDTVDKFHQAIRTAVRNVNGEKEWREDLKTLLTCKFQLFEQN